MTHFIRQQFLEVELEGSEPEGFALQHRLSGLCRDHMLPAIEKALDSCSTSGELIVIDRLDIDAGTIELDRIDQDLTSSVVKSLIQVIEKEIATNLSGKKRELISGFEDTNTIAQNNFLEDPEEKLWEVFIYFLEKGYLPWSYRLPTGKSLEEVIAEVLNNVGMVNSRIPVSKIAEVLEMVSSRKRLALQFSANFSKTLHQKVFGGGLKAEVGSDYQFNIGNAWEVFISFLMNGNLPELYHLPAGERLEGLLTELLTSKDLESLKQDPIASIGEVLKSESAVRRLVSQFSEDFIKLVLQQQSPDSLKELKNLLKVFENYSFSPEDCVLIRKLILEKVLLQLSSGSSISKTTVAIQVLGALKHKSHLLSAVNEIFRQTWPEINISVTRGEISRKGKPKSESIHLNLKEPEPNQTIDIRKAEQIIADEIGEGIYIENSGIVLLHPFLQRFFESLGISRKEEMLHAERAVSLLHYLTTGQTNIPEYELVLPKILCEFPLLSPVQADYIITENELAEASTLLEAVINHWEALRDTSPDTLRGTFLLRPGKLSIKEDGDWLLQVESRAFDVLMEYLPWGISVIRLPWMKKMLWVEWVF